MFSLFFHSSDIYHQSYYSCNFTYLCIFHIMEGCILTHTNIFFKMGKKLTILTELSTRVDLRIKVQGLCREILLKSKTPFLHRPWRRRGFVGDLKQGNMYFVLFVFSGRKSSYDYIVFFKHFFVLIFSFHLNLSKALFIFHKKKCNCDFFIILTDRGVITFFLVLFLNSQLFF